MAGKVARYIARAITFLKTFDSSEPISFFRGFNILAPNAKKLAQKQIFDCEGGGFQETYVLSRFSARGEDCVALKAYPSDWELFAFIEDYSYGGPMQTAIRLGSSKEEPTSKIFTDLLNERKEFKMNKTMRQLNNKL
jgi:hypothetical protein|eukprot:scaffold2192_cov268-Chaetoceros_neogracile.AAC.5